MKRILPALLCIIFIVMSFTACRNNANANGAAVRQDNGVYSLIDEAKVITLLDAKMDAYMAGQTSDIYIVSGHDNTTENPTVFGNFLAKTNGGQDVGIYIVWINPDNMFYMYYLSYEDETYYLLEYYLKNDSYTSYTFPYLHGYDQNGTYAYILSKDSELTDDALTKEENYVLFSLASIESTSSVEE